MKHFIYSILFVSLFISCQKEEENNTDYIIDKPAINRVHIDDNFWLPIIKTIQETTIDFGFHKCEEEGRMDNFLIAGGKMEGDVKGKMPFDDTDLYKIIEGASYSLITNPDPKLESYIDSIIAIISVGQEDDGYLTTWFTIDPNKPSAPWVIASGNRWHNVGGHELYNSGHLFEAAAAHYHATGKTNLLNIAYKNADLLVATFGPDKLTLPPGHQIVETGLIRLYQISKKTEYLELAKFFLDARGHATTEFMDGEYSQNHLPVTEQKEAVGHAVRAVYMYSGMTDIAAIYNDSAYFSAVNALWDNIVNKKIYITGGIGALHQGEAFGANYELPNLTAYNETCASIGNVQWNHRMFLKTGDAKYFNIIETTLYNGLISGISLDGKKFFYPNPLESDAKYEFNQGALTRKEWFDCSCCPTNLIRFIPSLPELIYATDKDDVYVNLFIGSHADLTVSDKNIQIEQTTNYPWNNKVAITLNPKSTAEFSLNIRVPSWVTDAPMPGNLYQFTDSEQGQVTVKINGEAVKYSIENGYIKLTHKWQPNDNIELELPMKVRLVVADKKVEEDNNKVAVQYGPIVYCAEEADNVAGFMNSQINENSEFEVEFNKDLLHGVNTIKVTTNSDKKDTLTLIPYYSWSNRGIGQMKVWLDKYTN